MEKYEITQDTNGEFIVHEAESGKEVCRTSDVHDVMTVKYALEFYNLMIAAGKFIH